MDDSGYVGEGTITIMTDENEELRSRIKIHLSENADVKQATITTCETAILRAASAMADALRSGYKLMLCGNGV